MFGTGAQSSQRQALAQQDQQWKMVTRQWEMLQAAAIPSQQVEDAKPRAYTQFLPPPILCPGVPGPAAMPFQHTRFQDTHPQQGHLVAAESSHSPPVARPSAVVQSPARTTCVYTARRFEHGKVSRNQAVPPSPEMLSGRADRREEPRLLALKDTSKRAEPLGAVRLLNRCMHVCTHIHAYTHVCTQKVRAREGLSPHCRGRDAVDVALAA